MAERLTESEVSKSFTEQELRTSEQARIYQKLGELEDILEKYGIESVEELDKQLANGVTWQEACELACDVLRDINYKIYNEDRIDFENTFYQQAKKEGENNDTNN